MKCKYPPCPNDVPATGKRPREYCSNAHKQADYRRRKVGTHRDTQDGEKLDALEHRVEDLERAYEVNTRLLNDWIVQSKQRIEELERALQETQDLLVNRQNQEEDQQIETFMARPGMALLLEREKTRLEAQPGGQEEKSREVPKTEPTYEGEWTITGTGGQVVYHDPDAQRARRRFDTLLTNDRTTKWQLHPPHFTPSSGRATEITTNLPNNVHKRLVLSTGEVIDFLADFTVPLPESDHPFVRNGYQCKATHKDVSAELTVYPHGSEGDYNLTQTKWGKTSPVGREGPKQAKRAQYLLSTLIDRTEGEMRKSGWIQSGTRDDVSPPRPLWRKANI